MALQALSHGKRLGKSQNIRDSGRETMGDNTR